MYLTNEFPKEILIERKARLEQIIKGLAQEQKELLKTLSESTLTNAQIRSIQEFIRGVMERLELADDNFATRRKVIEILDVQVALAAEGKVKKALVSCFANNGIQEITLHQ